MLKYCQTLCASVRNNVATPADAVLRDHLLEATRASCEPRFLQALQEQHRVGRMLTGVVLRHATADGLADAVGHADVIRACREFVRMFRAHEAWEDTELFPAFKQLVTRTRLGELGGLFEEIEHRKFGRGVFERILQEVVRLEHHLGIQGVEMFTPPGHAKSVP